MTVIRFPDSKTARPPEGAEQTIQAEREDYLPVSRGDNQAVRHFALTLAEKLLKDQELNHVAPMLVDRVVRMLVNESREVLEKN
ncbi:hypothetical protein [Pantoea latae]|uniref:Uncharacterized protein n=1 Tax=Pantoea latae TaxID=1964541 RepID=A0A1V9DA79_9GAMM|nr:hypothetical protein [Pantoea latae]OQP30706.1 hypothetical protein B2J69_20960 [Pantoea latae]